MPDSTPCRICSNLAEHESAFQKYGHPDDDTFLPAAANDLIIVKDFTPYGSRKLQLRQCPQCGTYYQYKTDYEFLVNGSEDEEYLTRLTEEQAAEYLNRPAPS
jgi:hypothetical protein